jgi:hypothetical protein
MTLTAWLGPPRLVEVAVSTLFSLKLVSFFLVVLGFELRVTLARAGPLPLEPLCQPFFQVGYF